MNYSVHYFKAGFDSNSMIQTQEIGGLNLPHFPIAEEPWAYSHLIDL